MQIIQITTGLDEKSGGPYFFAKEILMELRENKFQVQNFVFGGYGPINSETDMHSLNIRANRNGLLSIPRIRQLMALRTANLVMFHGFYLFSFFWVLMWTKNQIVVIPHGSISEYQHRKSKFRKKLFRKICCILDNKKKIKFYVASEQELQDTLMHFSNNVTTSLGLWVANSDLSQIRCSSNQQKNICVISRLHPIKNVEILLASFDLLRKTEDLDFRLFIAGEGEDQYIESLQKKVLNLGLKPYVEFLGHLNDIQKNMLWDESDLLCQISFYENFGQVVAESVMRGVPVIVSKNLGISSIIESTQTGIVVDPNDFQGIANAILHGLENYSQLRFNCIRNRYVFSKEHVAKRWIRQLELDCGL
jgi:glycosyltransferase involved in cell wall biosynthesis